LASEYVSKQVRVVPSINRPTRVNPSVFCSLKKESWFCTYKENFNTKYLTKR
jgi:hypothetical protein